MTRLETVEGKSLEEIRKGAYYRCFGNLDLASLLSRVQSLIIKNGFELEKLIPEFAEENLILDLDEYLQYQIMKPGVRVAEKKVIKQSSIIEGHRIEPDFIVFHRETTSQYCYIVELKDGYEYDTKASAKEHDNLHTFLSMNALALQSYQSFCRIVGFNAETRDEVYNGFKQKFAPEQVMTGAEFCELLGIDYEEIRAIRALDRDHNFERIIDELMLIRDIRSRINTPNG